MLRVLLAEDQALLQEGLVRILESNGMQVIARTDNAPELVRLLRRDDIDLAIIDVRMPPTYTTEGLAAATAARLARPGLPVIILSQHVESSYARELLADKAAGVGYLLKDSVSNVDAFIAQVRTVAGGGTALDPQIVSALVGAAASPLQRLTDREREVLTLVAAGRSNAAIAAELVITPKAVVKHTTHIFTKLDLPETADDNRRVHAVLLWLNEHRPSRPPHHDPSSAGY